MNNHKPHGIYERFLKRPFDVFFSLLALIVFCWLYALIALLVRINLGSPVLFKQKRPGKNEKVFELYKFRTMTEERDENGRLLSDEVRLTKFGKFLRKTSLDELPETFNIIRGNMSIVGPRPLLVEYLPRYNERQRRRHDVRPGLTGLAQVNGRNTCTWEEKFDYDINYVDNITFLGDVKIIFLTVFKAFFKQEGISSETSSTMEEFMGTVSK